MRASCVHANVCVASGFRAGGENQCDCACVFAGEGGVTGGGGDQCNYVWWGRGSLTVCVWGGGGEVRRI